MPLIQTVGILHYAADGSYHVVPAMPVPMSEGHGYAYSRAAVAPARLYGTWSPTNLIAVAVGWADNGHPAPAFVYDGTIAEEHRQIVFRSRGIRG